MKNTSTALAGIQSTLVGVFLSLEFSARAPTLFFVGAGLIVFGTVLVTGAVFGEMRATPGASERHQ